MKKPFKLTDADIRAIRSADQRLGSNEIRMCVRDLFVLGLHLRLIGELQASDKACSLALRTFGLSKSREVRILRNLDGNEHAIYAVFEAHAQFNSLIEQNAARGR